MAVFEKAKSDVLRLVADVMKKYHNELHEAGVTVEVLMASPTVNKDGQASGPPLKKNGYVCAALIKVVSLKDRAAGLADSMLTIDADQWKDMKEPSRVALIDHELEHLYLRTDADGETKLDDLSRPKLGIKAHDREVGWFDSVARRHGKAALEFQGFDNIWQSARQLNLPFTEIG